MSSYIQYWDVSNLYGLTMSQTFPVKKDTSQFDKDFIKNYNKESDEGEKLRSWCSVLWKLYNDLPFFPERMKIEKVEKLVANLHDKIEYVIHIRNLKQTLNHGLLF